MRPTLSGGANRKALRHRPGDRPRTARPDLRACFGLAIILCGLAVSAVTAPAAETGAYLAWLEREERLLARSRSAVERTKGADERELAAARDLAADPGPGLNVDETAWLKEDCAAILAAKPGRRLALVRDLRSRLAAYRQAVATEPPGRVNPTVARATLRSVLAGREFAWRPAGRSWREKLSLQIGDLVRRILFFLFESGIAYWTLLALGVLAAGGVLAVVLGALRGRRRAAANAVASDREGAAAPSRPGRKEDLVRAAEEAHGLGRHREALRLLYVALLQELDRTGAIHLVKHKTNWDYRREIAGNRPDLARVFVPFTELYETKWYGREPCGAEHYLTARRFFAEARGVGH